MLDNVEKTRVAEAPIDPRFDSISLLPNGAAALFEAASVFLTDGPIELRN
jgi:hypothetical protein